MDDGKPMIVSISDQDGQLQFEFVKTGEGIWAELRGTICKTGEALEMRVAREQIHLGPAAHWALGWPLANGGVFTFRQRAPNRLQIATHGWKGSFIPLRTD